MLTTHTPGGMRSQASVLLLAAEACPAYAYAFSLPQLGAPPRSTARPQLSFSGGSFCPLLTGVVVGPPASCAVAPRPPSADVVSAEEFFAPKSPQKSECAAAALFNVPPLNILRHKRSLTRALARTGPSLPPLPQSRGSARRSRGRSRRGPGRRSSP